MPDLKQVAVRMSDDLHRATLRVAKARGISFGELVRRAVVKEIQTTTIKIKGAKCTEPQ